MAKTTKPAATRRAKSGHPGTGYTCGQCARGTWSDKHTNRTAYDGKPFLKICEFSTYARNAAGQPVCLCSTTACPNFKEGER